MELCSVSAIAIFIAAFLLLTPLVLGDVSYLIPNKLLYEITFQASTHPGQAAVKDWLVELQDFLQCGVSFIYSNRLANCLVNRANYLRRKVRNSKGSAGRMKLLQQTWALKVLESEVARTALREIQTSSLPSKRRRTDDTPCSKRHERRLKKQRVENISRALTFLTNYGFVPIELRMVNLHSKQTEQLPLRNSLELTLNLQDETVSQTDEELIQMMLYVKDKYNVSGQAYHEMAVLCKQMPRYYRLKQKISELNSLWELSPTPNGTIGIQQNLHERLSVCLERMIVKDSTLFIDNIVRVKLTGDGTRLGKHLHVVNFAFTILDEGAKAYSASGNHCIAILKEEEGYASMKRGLQDIVAQVNSMDKIVVNDRELNIVFHLGGDWKFLAMVTGIGAATSTYACIWCKCPQLERHDTEQKWSITDTNSGARTLEENLSLSQTRSKEKYNVINAPLFPMIPLTRVVVDNLHMFLRISDTLIDLLLLELRRLDCIDKATKLKTLDSLTYLKLYENTLKLIGVGGFSFWIGKESRKLKYRTLTGPEKLILFDKLNIAETFPQVPNVEKVQLLWTDLLRINRMLATRPEEITPDVVSEFEKKAKNFLKQFVQIYPTKFVTPYMHCMAQHVAEFFNIHGAILPFTQQGLEKFNDTMTKDYFRSSSHRGVECLKPKTESNGTLGAHWSKAYTAL